MKKRYLVMTMFILLLIIGLTTVFTFAYFQFEDTIEDSEDVGAFSVVIKPYFIDNSFNKTYVDLSETGGILRLNISDYSDLHHLNKFGIEFDIKSNINVYFRIKILEQFALVYEAGGKETMVAVTRDNFAPLKYNSVNFFNNRLVDEYYYYNDKLFTNNINQTIDFITPLGFNQEDLYPLYDSGYTIILGFFVETVQADLGPNINWGLDNPPWDLGIEW